MGKGEIKNIFARGNKVLSFPLIQQIEKANKECHCWPKEKYLSLKHVPIIFTVFISHCVPCHNMVRRQCQINDYSRNQQLSFSNSVVSATSFSSFSSGCLSTHTWLLLAEKPKNTSRSSEVTTALRICAITWCYCTYYTVSWPNQPEHALKICHN